MFEKEMVDQLILAGVDIVVSLPCDKNKGFTDCIHDNMKVIDITREEDGVGICAGVSLMGKRPVMSIQSSGLGNMMNAVMSLAACYELPLVILASWRGVDGEKIEAQIPFNSRIQEMLDCYGISHIEIDEASDIPSVHTEIDKAFSENRITVILIHPDMWKESKRMNGCYPPRSRSVRGSPDFTTEEPHMTRLEAIGATLSAIGDEDILVSNIGVPSKEVMAIRDRPTNFYMLGSYTQATPIAVGMAAVSERRVFVIDGDGSLLGSSIFPVLSSAELKADLTVVCMDNGTFGSTGDQINPSYSHVDMASVARGYGIEDVRTAYSRKEIESCLASPRGIRFVQVMIVPGNSDSPNITYSAVEIKRRFMRSV